MEVVLRPPSRRPRIRTRLVIIAVSTLAACGETFVDESSSLSGWEQAEQGHCDHGEGDAFHLTFVDRQQQLEI